MDLFESRKQKKILIAGHRGNWGGSIAPNTIASYEAALMLGADIIEADIVMSKDGKFFAYHSGEEKGCFGIDSSIYDLTSSEIEKLRYRNSLYEEINQGVNYMDDVLEYLRGRCFINIDRGWKKGWRQILNYLKSKNMLDQIILKCPPEKELLLEIEENAQEIMYMGIIRTPEQYELIKSFKKVNTVAMEINYESNNQAVASVDFINQVHNDKLLAWCNSLNVNTSKNLAGGYDDSISIMKGPEYGWGKLIDKGYDIIQTDWPSLVMNYLENKGENRK